MRIAMSKASPADPVDAQPHAFLERISVRASLRWRAAQSSADGCRD
jgi:hypothetical protein